jgi:uncharacterized membrane protein YeiH
MTEFLSGVWAQLFAGGVIGGIDLIAASVNAFNGALLARRPDHYKHFTVMGIILLALAGGIGGGVSRDVLLNLVPAPLVNPWYIVLAVAAAAVALLIDFSTGQKFRNGLFAFFTAFSLPWYAIVGAQKALDHHLGYVAAVLIGVIGTTAGRYIIDISSGLVPKQFLRGELWVLNAVLTTIVYVLSHALGLSVIAATAVAVIFGLLFRLLAQFFGWEELEPWEPAALKEGEKPREKLGEALTEELEPGGTTKP